MLEKSKGDGIRDMPARVQGTGEVLIEWGGYISETYLGNGVR